MLINLTANPFHFFLDIVSTMWWALHSLHTMLSMRSTSHHHKKKKKKLQLKTFMGKLLTEGGDYWNKTSNNIVSIGRIINPLYAR